VFTHANIGHLKVHITSTSYSYQLST